MFDLNCLAVYISEQFHLRWFPKDLKVKRTEWRFIWITCNIKGNQSPMGNSNRSLKSQENILSQNPVIISFEVFIPPRGGENKSSPGQCPLQRQGRIWLSVMGIRWKECWENSTSIAQEHRTYLRPSLDQDRIASVSHHQSGKHQAASNVYFQRRPGS